MIIRLFEIVFMVTETCNNGNERRIKKSVFAQRFVNGHFFTEAERVAQAVEALKKLHYYNIEYVETKAVSRLVI